MCTSTTWLAVRPSPTAVSDGGGARKDGVAVAVAETVGAAAAVDVVAVYLCRVGTPAGRPGATSTPRASLSVPGPGYSTTSSAAAPGHVTSTADVVTWRTPR